MKVKVKIKSEQILEEGKNGEEHISDGEIQYLKNGAMLKFTEKFDQQEINFKMTILDNKIIIDRQGQAMTLDYEIDDNCQIDTPYGSMNMTVHTQEIKIEKKEELINVILLKYHITLENKVEYDNVVTIYLEY